ncbi:MAG: carbohydrate binding family 9 domain-containing protein [Flavobacterium sp.]|nr:carbohydrate binding family 9 domain-containing protein [Flavobacterium sp.]
MKYTFSLLFFFFFYFGFSQKKTLNTQFTAEKIVIDGKFDEGAWLKADVAKDFVMWMPDNGTPEPHKNRTEVRVVYDNEAVYFAATMYDEDPKKILKELSQRDDSGTTDRMGIFINGYNDGQQEFSFIISTAGVQEDFLYTETNGEDSSWNAIWESKTQITDFGWTAEIRIPYAALRFTSEKKQTWGINFIRDFRRDRTFYSWNLIDNKINSRGNQEGVLNGIENITTPTRLFLIPYSSFYLNSNATQKTKGDLKGGVDIKYGINDAFTLDAILVPDFGQTTFDNVILNLGPFEQQFNENRPFFTEGTELFSKGNLFYSRRIGGSPTINADLNDNESFTTYPAKVNLLNALKISGRTKNGLGIGVLNAVTEKTEATITNDITGATRKALIEPLANYNVMVLDQRFGTNSSVSFVNTNVTRNGNGRDGNVSALLFDLNTKKNTYNLTGDYKYSVVNGFGIDQKKGYNSSITFGETSGKFQFGGGAEYVSKDFDKDDMGIQFQSNYHSLYSNWSYRILSPTKTFNMFNIYVNLYSEFDNRSGRIQQGMVNFNLNSRTKKNNYYGTGFNARPIKTYDFYEPRTQNQSGFLEIPEAINGYFYFSSNYNNRFAFEFNPSYGIVNEKGRINYGISISPRYRFSDHFSLNFNFDFSQQNNNIGYVGDNSVSNEIFMGRRDRSTYINTLQGKFTINSDMNFNLSLRHYLSYATYNQYYSLQKDGSIVPTLNHTENSNSNFNAWNLDLSYSWWFAPGSQISILYRNNAALFENEFKRDLGTNIRNVIDKEALNHVFSVSVRYFIDYNSLKK